MPLRESKQTCPFHVYFGHSIHIIIGLHIEILGCVDTNWFSLLLTPDVTFVNLRVLPVDSGSYMLCFPRWY